MKFLVEETMVDILRHGEPEGGRRIRGQMDDPLSEQGWQQMWQAIGEGRPWTFIESSPLSRCAAFAEKLARENQLGINLDETLREIGFGAWEGMNTEELEQRFPGAMQRYWQDPINGRPQDAEPVEAFQARVHTGWERVLSTHQGKHILLVTHAGVMRIILGWVLNMDVRDIFKVQLPFAARIRVHIGLDEEGGYYPRLVLPDTGTWI